MVLSFWGTSREGGPSVAKNVEFGNENVEQLGLGFRKSTRRQPEQNKVCEKRIYRHPERHAKDKRKKINWTCLVNLIVWRMN